MVNDASNHDGHGHPALDSQDFRRFPSIARSRHQIDQIARKKQDQEIGQNRIVHEHTYAILSDFQIHTQKGQDKKNNSIN